MMRVKATVSVTNVIQNHSTTSWSAVLILSAIIVLSSLQVLLKALVGSIFCKSSNWLPTQFVVKCPPAKVFSLIEFSFGRKSSVRITKK